MEVHRGEVFYADLSPVVGSEQGGIRPVLIIQNEIGNRHSPTVFPSYQCGNVVREEVLEKHPELGDVLDKLQDTITDSDMAEMNFEVEEEGKDPASVATAYLKQKGLLK